ncbi:MAG: hypothetical protein ACRD5R_16285, partial [Candidatus Acidiferrales bacterium]
MSTSEEYKKLGMNRSIGRRDFLNGVAIGITGAYASLNGLMANAADARTLTQEGASPVPNAADYPPVRSGLRGNYPQAIAEFDPIRKGQFDAFPVADSDIQEEYDLV